MANYSQTYMQRGYTQSNPNGIFTRMAKESNDNAKAQKILNDNEASKLGISLGSDEFLNLNHKPMTTVSGRELDTSKLIESKTGFNTDFMKGSSLNFKAPTLSNSENQGLKFDFKDAPQPTSETPSAVNHESKLGKLMDLNGDGDVSMLEGGAIGLGAYLAGRTIKNIMDTNKARKQIAGFSESDFSLGKTIADRISLNMLIRENLKANKNAQDDYFGSDKWMKDVQDKREMRKVERAEKKETARAKKGQD